MTVEFVAFAVGVALLVVAALGGGIEVKEIRVPPLKPLPRVLATLLGAGLVLGPTGFGEKMIAIVKPKPAAVSPKPPEPKAPEPRPLVPDPQPAPPLQPALAPQPVAAPEPAPPADLRTEVTVEDALGDRQEYERVNIFINGENVGTVSIDEMQPTQSLRFKVKPGDTYRLSGKEASNRNGRLVPLTVRGGGTFRAPVAEHYQLAQVSHDDTMVTIEIRR